MGAEEKCEKKKNTNVGIPAFSLCWHHFSLCCYLDNAKALSREVKIEKILLKMFPFASLSP